MNRKAVAWLYGELPGLVAKGVLTAGTAERIREHYGPLSQGLARRTMLVLFGLIGAALVGLGIMLIIGHNWDQLSRLTRLLISLGLLVTAQAGTGLVLWRKKNGAGWLEEGMAVFLTLALGASIALVGQTYHLVDDFNNYMLVWLLLSLPLVYLMDVKGVAGMYLMGIVVWLASVQQFGMMGNWVWLLLILILPYYRRLLKNDRYANSTVMLSWLLIACFYSCFTITGHRSLSELLYALLFSITYFAGLLWFGDGERTWQKPFQTVGMLGSLGLAYFLSFNGAWGDLVYYRLAAAVYQGEYVLAFSLCTLAAWLGMLLMRRGLTHFMPLGLLPVVVGSGYLLHRVDTSGLYAAMLMNVYLLCTSINVIRTGVRETRMGMLNAGMLMLAALILLRFFDYTYSYYARGIVFIVLGTAFLVVNIMISRRKNGVTG